MQSLFIDDEKRLICVTHDCQCTPDCEKHSCVNRIVQVIATISLVDSDGFRLKSSFRPITCLLSVGSRMRPESTC
jgi:hypothetical protein